MQALSFNKDKIRHRYVFKIFTIGAEQHPTKLIFVKHLSVLNSHWEVFYKIPLLQLQNTSFFNHWEVFYKVPVSQSELAAGR